MNFGIKAKILGLKVYTTGRVEQIMQQKWKLIIFFSVTYSVYTKGKQQVGLVVC